MSRAAPRVLLAFAMVVAAGLVFSGAQPLPGEPEEKQPRLKFHGTMEDIPLLELIQLYTEFEKRVLVFDPKIVAGKLVTVSAPTEGVHVDIVDLLRSGLHEHGFLLVKGSPYDRIAPVAELPSVSRVVNLEELAAAHSLEPVSIVIHVKNIPASHIVTSVAKLGSGPGGHVGHTTQPGSEGVNALVVYDLAINVRSIVQAVQDADSESSLVSKVIRLKHLNYDEIAPALDAAAQVVDPARGRSAVCTVGYVASRRAVVLTGRDADVKRLEAVIAALDTAAD